MENNATTKIFIEYPPLSVSFDSVRVGASNQIFGRPDYGITKKTSIIPLSGKQLSLLFLLIRNNINLPLIIDVRTNKLKLRKDFLFSKVVRKMSLNR